MRAHDEFQNGVAGHLLVTVSPEQVRVDYVRSYLQKDGTPQNTHGEIAFSYSVKADGGLKK